MIEKTAIPEMLIERRGKKIAKKKSAKKHARKKKPMMKQIVNQ